MSLHLPGLNGVRFLAAGTVILAHVEEFKKLAGHSTTPWIIESGMAEQGVKCFFVLSGFLITYLLAAEAEKGGIQCGRFMVRRALRILPLYYLTVLFAYLVAPRITANGTEVGQNFLFHLCMLPHLSLDRFGPVMFAAQTWSIGVEEQFYFVWPWLLKWTPARLWPMLISTLVALKLTLQAPPVPVLGEMVAASHIEDLALGGLGGWLLWFHPEVARKWLARVPAVPLLVALLLFGHQLQGIAAPALYTVCLLNVTMKGCLEGSVCNWMGVRSYGLYMYHPFACWLAVQYGVAVHGLAWLFTVAMAAASYEYFESPLLRLKARFGSLSSGGGG